MTMTKFIPQLAASLPCTKLKEMPTAEMVEADLKKLDWTYGFLASPKIDGIRAIHHGDHGMLSRTLKPIPNRYVQQCMKNNVFEGFDGELIKGRMEDMVDFNSTQSMAMSEHGEHFFTFCVFDDVSIPHENFLSRNQRVKDRTTIFNELAPSPNFQLRYIEQEWVKNIEALLRFEERQIAIGWEGVIFRSLATQYIVNKSKDNRSTFKQQSMIKLKRFNDAEAVITGYEELQTNTNEPTQNAFGRQIRSSHLAGMVGAGTLGKVLAKGINGEWKDVDFAVGSGFDEGTRDLIWLHREIFLGKPFKYKYQPSGSKDAPRSPIWLGLRDPGY